MRTPLLIYGAGGLGREILSLVRSLNDWEVIGFLDDGVTKGTMIGQIRVLGSADVLHAFHDPVHLVLAIGDPATKADLVKKIDHRQALFPILVHPSVIQLDEATIRIGQGSIITAGCVLTTNIEIGTHVLINLNTTVGHDTRIGSCSSVMPGVNIAGKVNIGTSVLVGSGANLINGVSLGDNSKVGMGAAVVRDVSPGTTVVGVPAKPLRI